MNDLNEIWLDLNQTFQQFNLKLNMIVNDKPLTDEELANVHCPLTTAPLVQAELLTLLWTFQLDPMVQVWGPFYACHLFSCENGSFSSTWMSVWVVYRQLELTLLCKPYMYLLCVKSKTLILPMSCWGFSLKVRAGQYSDSETSHHLLFSV